MPPPDTPVTAVKTPSGIVGGDVLQVVAAGADDRDRLLFLSACGARRHRRSRELAGQILAGERVRVGHHLAAGVPCGDDLAAVDAGGGAHVDDIVGRQDRVLVMLDDDHGVAEVAQVLQRVEQAGVVALVQADRRLVQHVEHAGQARADLRGQADALALAARQRARVARQAEIVEADIVAGTAGARGSP